MTLNNDYAYRFLNWPIGSPVTSIFIILSDNIVSIERCSLYRVTTHLCPPKRTLPFYVDFDSFGGDHLLSSESKVAM